VRFQTDVLPHRGHFTVGRADPVSHVAFAYVAAELIFIPMPRSYERLRAEIDAIVEQYRVEAPWGDRGKHVLSRAEAVKRICQLGFTEGDANRWLGSKPHTKPLRLTPRE